MTGGIVKGMVATRFDKAVNIGLVVIVGVWHLGLDTLLVLRGWPEYEPRAAAAGAWLALAVIQTAGSILHGRGDRTGGDDKSALAVEGAPTMGVTPHGHAKRPATEQAGRL